MAKLIRRSEGVNVAWTDDDGNNWLISFKLVERDDGRIEPIGMEVEYVLAPPSEHGPPDFWQEGDPEPPALTGSTLRQMPLARLVREASRYRKPLASVVQALGELQLLDERLEEARARRRGGKRYTDEDFELAAEVYTLAIAAQEPPARRVAEAFDIERASARNLLSRLRKRGLLPETTQGKARGGTPREAR